MAESSVNLREGILETGARILADFGFGRLTQPQVSKELGITQSRLTYYFPKREDLLIGVVDYASNLIAKEVYKRASGGSMVASSSKLFSLINWIVCDRKRTNLILNIFFESNESPELRERIKKIILKHQSIVGTALGKKANHPDAAIVMAVIWGLGIQHYILENERSDNETKRILKRFEKWLTVIEANLN